jgi:TP901-1 family phage major tail protein
MAAQKGSAVLIKQTISGAETTIGGLRSSSLTINEETVDVTNKDSSGNRELLADGGILSMSISGSGVFTDSTAEQSFRSAAVGATTFQTFTFVIPDLGSYAGTFQVTSLEYAGEYNGEATYSFSLESSGAITFSAA